ncbi:MAG TPA: hypothetical protein VMQ54_13320 [Steroidobacteraceae bacterium]|jgi:hypothetical protein|nr:hypothetical protein [Steroidobacteraceae bacterium]
MKKHKSKKQGAGLEIKTFKGKTGDTYVVYRTPAPSSNLHRYHVFVEVEAKAAGKDCGGNGATTHHVWRSIWDQK